MFIFANTAMINVYKGKAKYILAFATVGLLLSVTSGMGNSLLRGWRFDIPLTTDTVPKPKIAKASPPKKNPSTLQDSVLKKSTDSVKITAGKDSIPSGKRIITSIQTDIDTLPIRISKDTLDAPVTYHADDSMVMDVPGKKIYLYGRESQTQYIDNDLTAPVISFDQRTSLVMASLQKDSTGKVLAFPTFIQGESKTVSDTIVFNMKNGKGITKGTYTKEGEMYVYGERIKKINATEFYVLNGRFTTCNLDTPHFSFVSKKIKFRNKKFAVTGPVHPEFEGVPVPIILPFGIYPLSLGRHSGFIMPNFTANEQFGLALEGIGYYKVLSDNWDVTTRATIYSYGGYTLNINPRYSKRYHYQGALLLDIQRFKYNFPGDPDFATNNTFNIRWSHNADTKARPGVTFSASVNAGSSKFNQQVPNSPTRNFQNQLSSSIAYAKTWKDKPFSISINANHSQNTNLSLINLTFPDVSFNLQTLYPFRRKEQVGKTRWYENIGVGLNSSGRSQSFFYDLDSLARNKSIGNQISDNLQWGVQHNVPINLSLPQIGPLQVSPGITYSEKWYQEKRTYSWNAANKKLDTSINRGFYSARDMSFSLGISTRIFGSYVFKKESKVQAIRHEIRPSISISYKPNMNSGSYYDTQVDTAGRFSRFSFYNNSLYGAFGEGTFGGIGFNIDNNLQMKLRNPKDTSEAAVKKVSLIDGFGIGGSYNFLIDSFQFSTLSLNVRSNLFDKISITASASFDPYDFDLETGRRLQNLLWTKKVLTLGRLTSAIISMSTQFQGGDPKNKKQTVPINPSQLVNQQTGMPLDEYQTEAAYINNNPAEFADFSIPWSFSINYAFQLGRVYNPSTKSFTTNIDQNISWNNTLGLSPKWQIGFNGYYNISTQELGTLSMSISREMHCWQMAINISPVGRYRFFNFTISPKSGILRDLKVNRTRYFYDL